jgi:hypothetical protein
VDSDEHRRTLTGRGNPHPSPKQEATPTLEIATSQPPAGSATLKGTTKGRTRCRNGYGGPERVTPKLAWHPALRPHSSPNDAR